MLTGKNVLVVGGTSGIGLATGRAALDAGAQVTVASRDEARVRAAADAVGRGARGEVLDAGDEAAVERFFAGKAWDHVAVTAASTRVTAVKDMPLADAYAAMDGKFWNAYRVARAATVAPGGSITLVAGLWSHRPFPNTALVSAINSGIEGLTRGLALELAPVRVNCVSPGIIDTPIWSGMPEQARRDHLAGTAERLPVGRVGQPEDVAMAMVMLMANPFATGTVLFLDGGGLIA
jgi:NAD(P)-dependent dehydrogenase (short-subunit alcohol dehydrogenase family)